MFVEIFKGKKVAVAVSGGIDSVVLLDRLVKETKGLDVTLSVVNVDHCIREESASDSLFVKELAAFYGLPFFPFKVDALTYAEENGLSEETAARVLRYDCFEKVDCDYIALAHHMSDQAESILMHILRGSGSKGAVGMRRVNGRYVRPLLDTPKEDIERYAAEKGLKYVVDKTNFENDKTRNFLRNVVFEELKKINPKAIENVCRFGENVLGDVEFIEREADKINLEEEKGKVKIPFSAFDKGEALAAKCIFNAASKLGVDFDIENRHVKSVAALAEKGESGSRLDLPYGIKVFKDYDGITFLRGDEKEKNNCETEFKNETVFFDGREIEVSRSLLDGGLYYDGDKLPDGCVLRHRRDGDFFRKFGGGRKKLKDFLIDKKIPARERDALVLLAKGSEVFIVVGVEISDDVKVDKKSKNILSIKEIVQEKNL